MKNIYILFLLGVVVTTLSCEDGNKNYTEEFDSVYYYLKEGVNEFDFYSVNSAKVQTITVGRGGHGLNGVSTINLVPFTQAEMAPGSSWMDFSTSASLINAGVFFMWGIGILLAPIRLL